MTILTTDRLTLTPVRAEDFDEVRALWADARFTDALGIPAPLGGEDVWLRLLRDIGHWRVLGHGNWTLRTRDGVYVGSVGVLDYRRDIAPALTAPELGWGLTPAFQGLGYAREAVGAALDWCDRSLKAPRTVCIISADNAASLKLARAVGYGGEIESIWRGKPILTLTRPSAAH